jgi:hypothetical protein
MCRKIAPARERFFNTESRRGGRRAKLLTAKDAKKGREEREENLRRNDTKDIKGTA